MSKQKKILATSLWAMAVLMMVGIIATLSEIKSHQAVANVTGPMAGGQDQPPMPEFDVAPFSMTNQLGQTVTNTDLKGHVWIAAFIFTRCTQLCPMMAVELSTLQQKITNPSVKLVSFSVDPKYDTPAVLKAYGQQHNADPDRWWLVTGDATTIGNVATSLKLGVALGEKPGQLTHSDKFVLIGPDGKSRGIYNGTDDIEINRLARDAEKLAAGTP